MEIKWTDKQIDAITSREKNLLVSAAAGSGKTAVLVERIKQMILKGECSLDHMLIVTFTNAAAQEMKEKIAVAINHELSNTEDEKAIRSLKNQLDLMPKANISTFHAFALNVIKRYFYVIQKEPNFKICDEAEQTLLKEESLDELLEGKYALDDNEFYNFLNKHSGDRNDEKLRAMILNVYETIQSLPEPFSWLENQVEILNSDIEEFKKSGVINYVFLDTEKRLNHSKLALNDLRNWACAEKLEQALVLIDSDIKANDALIEIVKERDFDKVSAAVSEISLTKLLPKYYDLNSESGLTKDEIKEKIEGARSELKEAIKLIKEEYFYDELPKLKEDISKTYSDAKYLQDLVKEFNLIYQAKKDEKGLADFSDIEHWAYQILCQEEPANFYRDKFEYIYIDEYQDSNILQDELIAKIKRPNNLFMVGDIKQSIYKFRLAKPEIFQEKYEKYAEEYKNSGEKSKSKKIDLNSNFRSKIRVIDFVNDVFTKLMFGYDDDAKLYPGDPNALKGTFDPKLYLAKTAWDEDDDAELDDELKNIKKAEKEALATVKIINDHLGKMFYDSKQSCERPLELNDIVILMRGVKSYGDQFYKVLMNNGINCYIDDNEGLFDTLEINLMLSLLSIIDNEKQDIPLLTVMRSEVWSFSIDEMIAIRLAMKKSTYYDALKNYALAGEIAELKEKCNKVLTDLKEWRHKAKMLPLEEFVWNLILDTGLYIAMGALPAGAQRQANLRALTDKALAYRNAKEGSLYGFMRYIDAIKAGKVPMGQVKMVAEGDKTVRIMTIHKSKGLEFPMVILAGFCRRLNYDAVGKNATIHDELGLALPIVNYEESWYKTTLLQRVIKQKIHREEVDEEQRVLYVAMTRARDILAIVGILDDVNEEVEKIKHDAYKDTSYFTMIGKTVANKIGTVKEIYNSELLGISKGRKRFAKRAISLIDESPKEIGSDVEKKLTYSYANKAELNTKSKYSVSELNAQIGDERALAVPSSYSEKQSYTQAQIGTLVHKVLELIDFKDASLEGIKKLINQMVDDEHITADEAEFIDCDAILRFLNSDLGRRIARSESVHREQPFNIKMDVKGIETLVQGVIDCYFIEDGSAVLLDYKTTKQTNEEKIRLEYQTQIDIYKRAIEESTKFKVKEAHIYLTNSGKLITY